MLSRLLSFSALHVSGVDCHLSLFAVKGFMALSHTFQSRYADEASIPNYYRSSVFCLEKLTTSGISLLQLEAKFKERIDSPDTPQGAYTASVLDRVAHIRRIAIQLGEDIARYPQLQFPPGKLLEELNYVIAAKEKELLETKKQSKNKESAQVCDQFLYGICSRGVTCSFSHTTDALVSWLEHWLAKQVLEHGDSSLTITESFGPEAWFLLFDLIAKQGSFHSLVLRGSNRDGLKVLIQAIRSNAIPSLQFLDIGKNNLGEIFGRGILKLSKAMGYNSTICGLCIGHNSLGAAGALSLCDSLYRSQSSLVQTLNLQSNGISSADPAFNYFCSSLAENVTLRKLSLAANDLGPDGTKKVLDAIESMESLEFLDLSSTGMGDSGVAHLAKFLAETDVGERLRLLNVSWNKMSHEGCGALCDAILQHKSIEILRMHYNIGIGRKGAMSISELLRNCTSLSVLDLRWTALGDDGVSTIMEGLGANNTIREIALYGNELSAQAEASFLDRMKKRQLTANPHLPPGVEPLTRGDESW